MNSGICELIIGLYQSAKVQALLGITFDGMQTLPQELRPKRELYLKWCNALLQIEENNHILNQEIAKVYTLYRANQIEPVLLKGQGVAQNYRNPLHRQCGDIDLARATGKTGVCIATSGPGATNLITGLADALLDSIPVVAITGQVSAPFIGTDAFQEVDVLGLSLACTKHSFLVQSLEELPRIMAEAFDVSNCGRTISPQITQINTERI